MTRLRSVVRILLEFVCVNNSYFDITFCDSWKNTHLVKGQLSFLKMKNAAYNRG